MIRLQGLIAAAVLLISLCACANGGGQSEVSNPPSVSPARTEAPPAPPGDTAQPQTGEAGASAPAPAAGEIVISFDYERISGAASNQYAVWIEDMDGGLIKTLYASRWTAGGGYKTRPDSIALWVEKSGLASMTKSEVDAVSGATPRTGAQTYSWDLTGAVLPGDYKVFVEGTLRWKNYVLYSGTITIGGAPATVEANAEYVYEASDRQAALTGGSPENAMIGAVIVSFIPGETR